MRFNPAKIAILSLLALCLARCGKPVTQPYAVIDGFTQGSTYHIVYYDPEGRNLQSQIEELLEDIDNSFSIYNPSSTLSLMNANDTTVQPDPWILDCFRISQEISEDTDGAFDVTLRPLIAAYKIGTNETPYVLSQNEIDAMLPYLGYKKARIVEKDGKTTIQKSDSRIQFDFNAVAQGYSADLMGEMLESLGVENYLVEIGGEIYCKGRNPQGKDWRIAIDSPFEGNFVPGQHQQAVLSITDKGVVTSGNYRKFAYDEHGTKVVHTIDPKTMRPVTHNLLSATVIAPTSTLADGYATACMAIGLDKSKELLARHDDLEGLLIYALEDGSMRVYMTPGLKKHVQKK